MGKYATRYNENKAAKVATPIDLDVMETKPQETEVTENNEVTEPSKPQKKNNENVDKRTKKYKTVSKTQRVVAPVFDEAEVAFKMKQLEGSISKKMTWGMYISDLMYQDTHNGEHLFDYSTGELIQEIE